MPDDPIDPITPRDAAWADLLIPGDAGNWPSATAALGHEAVARVFRSARADDRGSGLFDRHASQDVLTEMEARRPDIFERLLTALYTAYYTSAPVRSVIDSIAASSVERDDPR